MRRDPDAYRAYLKVWRAKNKAKIAAYDKAHRDRRLRNGRLTAQRRKLHRAAVKAAWHERHRSTILAKKKALRAARPGWNAHNDAKRRQLEQTTSVEKIDYAAVIAKANGLCGICEQPLGSEAPHIDHIVPLSRGGAHVASNLQASHATCNRRKGSKIAA